MAAFDLIVAAAIPNLLGERGYRAVTYVGAVLLAVAGYVALALVMRLAVAGVGSGA